MVKDLPSAPWCKTRWQQKINNYDIQGNQTREGKLNFILFYFYFHLTNIVYMGRLSVLTQGECKTVSKTHLVSNVFYRVNMVLR
jgi:hypothetical protein